MDDSIMPIDMATASVVEFLTDGKGKVWVNVDGLCMLRIGFVTTQILFTDETGTIVRKADDSTDLNEAIGGADELDFGPESEWGNHVAPAVYDNSPALSAYAMDESYMKEVETKPLYTILPGRGIARDGKPTVYIRSEEPMNVSPSEFEEYFRELVDQLNEY